MNRLTWLLLLLPLVTSRGNAQVCSDGVCSHEGMTFIGSTQECQEPQGALTNFLYPAGGSETWDMWMKNASGVVAWHYLATETVPMVPNSSPAGDGKCDWEPVTGWSVCPGVWQTQTIFVTEADGYNYYQYFLRGYGASFARGGGCEQSTSYYGQVYQTSNVTCCPAPTGCCANPSICNPGRSICEAGGDGSPSCVCVSVSPIIIPTGKGYSLTNAKEGVPFDFMGNGRKVQMGWTTADSEDGFLVCLSCWPDMPYTGTMDGRFWFGNITKQPKSDNPNGFLALAEFDSNHDGVIDWHDDVWPKLQVWINPEHDGVLRYKDLHSLAELGVKSISLKYTDDTHDDSNGNQFHYKSMMNGDMPIYDIFFVVEKQKAFNCPQKVVKSFTAVDHLY
jgi:hypothetical protein